MTFFLAVCNSQVVHASALKLLLLINLVIVNASAKSEVSIFTGAEGGRVRMTAVNYYRRSELTAPTVPTRLDPSNSAEKGPGTISSQNSESLID